MDWLDILSVQETLKSLLQNNSLKASILWHSAPFIVQISHASMTSGKPLSSQSPALTSWSFVVKVMSLLFNMLSSLVIIFLPRSKDLLILWHQSPSAVILDSPQNSLSLFALFAMKWWDQIPWSLFSECWFLSQLFHSPLSLSSRGSLVVLHFVP